MIAGLAASSCRKPKPVPFGCNSTAAWRPAVSRARTRCRSSTSSCNSCCLDFVLSAATAASGIIGRGDRVAIYMPMIPEAAVAMLACARIGATHNVVFGGFSVDALKGRIQDADAKLVITADGGYRRGAPSALKPTVDAAAA